MAMPISSDDGDEDEDRDVDRRVWSVQRQAITTSGITIIIISLNQRSWSVGEKACASRRTAVSRAMDARKGLGGIG